MFFNQSSPCFQRRSLLAGLLGGALCSCSKFESEKNDLGIPRVELNIDVQDLSDIRGGFSKSVSRVCEITLNEKKLGLIDIRISGQISQFFVKKSFACKFVNKDQEVFVLRTFRLAAMPGDPSLCRAKLGYELFSFLKFPVPSLYPVALFINRDWIGLYHVMEDISSSFFSRRNIEIKEYYQSKSGTDYAPKSESDLKFQIDAEHGNSLYTRILDLHKVIWKMSPEDAVTRLDPIFDLNVAARYYVGQTYMHHWDSFANNHYLYNSRQSNVLTILPWDLDKVFNNSRVVNLKGTNYLFDKLISNPIFFEKCREYAALLHKTYTNRFLEEKLTSLMSAQQKAWELDRLPLASFKTSKEAIQEILDIAKNWFPVHKEFFKV